MMCVSLRMVAAPSGSSSDAYWMFASRVVSVGSGIVTARHSHASGSSLFVLSSSLSTGVSCCMILFLDLGWVGGCGGGLDAPVLGWSSIGAVVMLSVLCLFFGVCPSVLYLLGVLWVPCVTCAQLARFVFSGGVSFLVARFEFSCLVGVFCPLSVACA